MRCSSGPVPKQFKTHHSRTLALRPRSGRAERRRLRASCSGRRRRLSRCRLDGGEVVARGLDDEVVGRREAVGIAAKERRNVFAYIT
jgi:hypothetical protein